MSNRPTADYTGLDWLKIDIANTYGLDKKLFEDRIKWFDEANDPSETVELFNNSDLYAQHAEEPLLFKKAVLAYNDVKLGNPIGHNMFLDATASGLQIMAALSGCKKTAEHVNLINNGKRNDVYTFVADEMNRRLGRTDITRSDVKKPLMTHYYNSRAKPREIFGEESIELKTFYDILQENFAGAEAVMTVINNAWNPDAYYHEWTLPDGHVAHVKVTEQVNTRIEVDELDHMQFAYRFYPNQPSKQKTSLAPNVIHSIDAYVVREMIRRADFELAHIHDAFTFHPNNGTRVTELYREIFAEIAESNLMNDIIAEITGKPSNLNKFSYDLADDIRESEYMLS